MITLFENFNNDWKIGNIVVPIRNIYTYHGKWLKEDTKYKIVDIEYIEKLNIPQLDRQYRIQVEGLDGTKYLGYYHKFLFISEHEYDSNKYNL